MNAFRHSETHALSLVDIIDLKWLLAGEGLHLHVERLQREPSYARGILDAAAQSPNPALADVAARLRKVLGV